MSGCNLFPESDKQSRSCFAPTKYSVGAKHWREDIYARARYFGSPMLAAVGVSRALLAHAAAALTPSLLLSENV
jgi:hypothetical protein